MPQSTPLPRSHYAGFWQRAAAASVDGLLASLLALVLTYLLGGSRLGWVIYFAVIGPVYMAYEVWAHAKFGKTIGKWFVRIRVVDLQRNKISWLRSLVRHSPVIFLGILGMRWEHDLLQNIPADLYPLIGSKMIALGSSYLTSQRNSYMVYYSVISMLWMAIELFSVLANAKRRSFHDLIAGTQVLRSPAAVRQNSFLRSSKTRTLLSVLIYLPAVLAVFRFQNFQKEFYPDGTIKTEPQDWGNSGSKLTLYWDNGKPHYLFEFKVSTSDQHKVIMGNSWKRWDRDGKILEEKAVE